MSNERPSINLSPTDVAKALAGLLALVTIMWGASAGWFTSTSQIKSNSQSIDGLRAEMRAGFEEIRGAIASQTSNINLLMSGMRSNAEQFASHQATDQHWTRGEMFQERELWWTQRGEANAKKMAALEAEIKALLLYQAELRGRLAAQKGE